MVKAAAIIYELVYMNVPDDGDLNGFANMAPAIAGFVNGPFHTNNELTRFLEIRSLYVPHLVVTLAGVLKGRRPTSHVSRHPCLHGIGAGICALMTSIHINFTCVIASVPPWHRCWHLCLHGIDPRLLSVLSRG